MSVVLKSSGGGSVTLQEPATASDFTHSLPAVTGTVVTTGDTGSVTPTMLSQKLTQSTSVASTSGAAVDFTGIPSWAKRIIVVIADVSINNNIQVQLGTGAGPTFTTSGYDSCSGYIAQGSSTQNAATFTTGFTFSNLNQTGLSGLMIITNITGNTWVYSAVSSVPNNVAWGAGSVALGAALTAVRVTSTAGSRAFSGGTINIMWE